MAKKRSGLSDAQYQKMYGRPRKSKTTGSSSGGRSSSSSSSSQQANERGRARTARTNAEKQRSYTPTRTTTVHGRGDRDAVKHTSVSSSSNTYSTSRNVGMNRTQGSSSNTDRTSAGTAIRAKEAWNRLEEDRKRREEESRARRNQKMTGGVTKADQQKTRQRFATARQMMTERAKEAQKQKMGAQVSEEEQTTVDRALRNTPGLVKKAVMDTVQGHGKTIADLTELTASNKNGTQAIAMKMGIDPNKDKNQMRELERQRRETARKAKEDRERWQKQQEKRQAEWDEKTKNAKGLEKAYYGAVESGVGMLTDTALGLGNPGASLVAMGSRTYGSTRGQAQKEGATEREDRIYSLLQAGKEVGTELMFPGAGLARRAYGRAGLPLAEKAANALTRSLRGRTADITRAGLRLLGGTVEENAEEIAGWGLDPLIKEFTYGRNVRRRDAKETMNRVSESIRSNIQSEEDAVAASAYLSSASFLDETKREYMAEGMSEADAEEVALKMRDFLTASLIGDTDTMEKLEDEVSKKVAGTKLDWDWKELGETIASTTLLTGVTGLPGAITTAARGAAIRDELGTDGVRALANTAVDFEDEKDSYKGQAARDRIDSGAELTSTQVYDLAEAMQKQTETDNKRNVASKTQAIDVIENEKLVIPYGVNQNNGNLEMDDVVADKYESDAREASNTIRSYESTSEGSESLTDTEVRNGSKAIAGFKSGIFTVEDANELNYRNTAVRSAFESETGVNLEQYVVKNKDGTVNVSATNAATKDALFAMASDNLVESARVATANWMDNVKGEVVTQVTARMGAQGSVAFQAALDDVDERNRSDYMMVANASDMLYQSARNMGTEWDNVKDQATKMFPQIAESKLEAMYNAGLEDRRNANDILRNRSIHIGNALTEVGEQERSPEAGRVFIDTETSPKGTVVRAFSELASNLGVDIHLVDNIETSSGKQANGYYINGAIYINVNSDFEQNMGYIFMHEVTHHLKMIAPEEYAALENLVREKWFEYDDAQMQNEIARKIQSYADAGQTLTEEEALEEIIADAAHEFLNDPNFANQVAEENPTLAKAILNSIRNALRMLRRVLATGSIDDETHMNNLFSQLDIFDEAEKLWLNAYTAAYQNKAALAIDNWQDEANERYSTAETNAGVRYSITEQQDSDYMNAVESGDMETAQRMVDEAAKQKGYTPRLYHGTSAFGFTEFDLNKMDDKTSIFLTDNEEIASTYSGKPGSKAINERSNLDYANMSMKDIVDSLNGANISVADEAVSYDYYDAGRIEALKLEIDSGLNKLSEIVDSKVTEYAERMAEDFNDTDMKTHKQLVQLKKKLDLYKEVQEGKRKVSNPDGLYIEFSTPTYLLLNNTDAFDNVDYDVKSLEENIRLFDLLNKEMNRGEASKSADNWQNYFDAVRGEGFIVERALDGYHLEYLPRYEAINKLRSAVDAGNYALYAKLENPLVIDADGAYWKSIPVPRELLSSFADDYHSHADGNMVMNFEDGRTVTNTRSLASYAKRAGYDGVILNNLKDHGGLRYDEVPHDLDANIYIAFDPNAVASADPVTYDDNGNVIPLSQRFNIEKPDIRYSISDTMSVLEDNFNEYKEDKTNLRIATEALDDLQRVRYALSESSERDVSGRWDGGVQVRTIAKGISTELVREGYVEFRGQKVDSPEDLAKLCQVLRDPRFETFRLVLTKNNKIVSFQSISARMPGVSPIHNRETDEDYDKYVLDLVARTKADGFYMLHNHPSGNVSASRPDLVATAKMINLLGSNMFKGHVILDHDKYGLIEDIPQTVAEGWVLPSAREVEIPGQQTLDLIHEPEVDHELLGERVSSPEAVAQIGAHVNTSDDMSVLVYVGSSGGVRGIQEISNKTLANDEGAKGFIRNQATEFGSSLVFLYKTSDDSSVTKAALNLYKDGILRDVVSSDWSQSFEARGIDQTGDATQQGYSSQELRNRAVVFETASGAKDYSGLKYSITPKMDADYMAAVNEGNMEEAQRLVEEAARMAGYNSPLLYHGTYESFNVFKPNEFLAEINGDSQIKGYFSEDKSYAENYGTPGKYYVRINNPLDFYDLPFDQTKEAWINWFESKGVTDIKFDSSLEEDTLKGAHWEDGSTTYSPWEIFDGSDLWAGDGNITERIAAAGYDGMRWDYDEKAWIPFDDTAIKSADTVTYAEDGSIIPLSERFNPENNDVRYSLTTTDADGKVLSDGQMEYFKNSQARDEQGRLVRVFHTTNKGGFTVFDPSFSDDRRSLFFASNFAVSQSYGINAAKSRFVENPSNVHSTNYRSFNDFMKDVNGLLGRFAYSNIADFIESNKVQIRSDDGIIAYEWGKTAEERFNTWLERAENGEDLEGKTLEMGSPGRYVNKTVKGKKIKASSYEELINRLNEEMSVPQGETILQTKSTNKTRGQAGYYECYLNLENPLIVDAGGSSWNRIPYGEQSRANPIRQMTIDYMNEEAAFKVQNVTIEFDEFDDDFENGNYRKLRFGFVGAKKSVNGGWINWTENEDFTVDEEAVMSGDEFADENLTNQLAEHWVSMGLSMDYLDEVMTHFNDFTGAVDYTPATDSQALTEDYLDLDGYQYSYEELFDDFNLKEADGKYAPYEGIESTRSTYRTRELAEMAQNEGYDGVIIKNCRDIGPYGSGRELSDIYIAFSSNQVKDVNNLNPTENPDIRYSITPEDDALSRIAYAHAMDNSNEALEYYEQLIDRVDPETYNVRPFNEEKVAAFYAALNSDEAVVSADPVEEESRIRMARSKADFFNNLNTKWNDRWHTEGEVLDVKSVKTDIRNLVMGVMSNSDTDHKYRTELVNKMLMDVRTAFQLMKQGRQEVAASLLYHSALRMVESAEFYVDDTYDQYKDLKEYFKTTKISLGEEYWSDVDFGSFRKNNFGRMKLVKGSTNVDQIYMELCEMFPEWFREDETLNVPDQLEQMAHVLDSVQPYKEAYTSEAAAELAFDIADELYDIMVGGKEIKSLADQYKERYDAKTKAMKQRHAEAMLRMRRQRDLGVQAERAKWRAREEARKEKTAHNKYFDRINKNYNKLVKRLFDNTKDSHIPEQYKKELAKLLSAFDLQTVGSKKVQDRRGVWGKNTIKMAATKAALANISNRAQDFKVNDAITDLMDDLLASGIDGKTIDELSVPELQKIDDVMKALVHEFNNYDKVVKDNKKQTTAVFGNSQVDDCLKHAEIFGPGKDYHGLLGALDKIINLDEQTAAYLFRRIDPNYTGIGAMWKEVRKSFDKYVRNTAQLKEWMEEITGEYHNKGRLNKYGSDVIDSWRSANYAKAFKLTNGTVQLTPAQMMSIYCLAKRPQAYGHMVGAGIVVRPVSFNAKLMTDLKKKLDTSLPVILTDADIKTITKELTPDQIKVADKLQELMSTKMAAWGNEASMEVIGIELFHEANYFPIKSDKAALESDLSADQFVDSVRNFGFAKAVAPGARNAIVVDDIFDVVAEHCNNMNLYNSYSRSMDDFMKVLNYRQFREDGREYTVKQAIGHAYSQKAVTFILQMMRDLNGNVSGGDSGISSMYNRLLSNAKAASVMGNGRVLLQQPTAITRAFAVINPKYIKGIRIDRGVLDEMWEHCPIALWKSWGYYDINMGRPIEDVIMNNGSISDDLLAGSYGVADNITWAAMWQMVKAEMKDTHPDVEIGTDEYWELANERMSEIVDFTQVVDSPIHRSHGMRSKNYLEKTATSFMAEPTLTFNMIKDGLIRTYESWKLGDKKAAAKILGVTASVFATQAITVSIAQALWDTLRGKGGDDDDEEEKSKLLMIWQNFLENLGDEVKIWNKVYFIKDIDSLIRGYGFSNMALQGFKMMIDGWNQLTGTRKVFSSKSWYENFFGGFGYITGMPIQTLIRDTKAIYNLFGFNWNVANEVGEYLDSMPDAFNSNSGEGAEATTFLGKLMNIEGKSGESKSGKGGKKSSGSDLTSPDLNVTMDGYMTDAELKQDSKDKLAAVKDKVEGLPSTEKNQAIFDKTNDLFGGYTNLIEKGRFNEIERMRSIIEAAGGNVNDFDAKVLAKSKTAYKKTLGDSMKLEQQWATQDYLKKHGVSDEEISELCYKSYTKSDLVYCWNNGYTEAAEHEMFVLASAGMTEEDFAKAYKYRNRQRSYNGKYTDEEYVARWTTLQERKTQSTGKFTWPTDGIITSDFGGRESPGGIGSTNHQGIDIGASTGTPACAADGGEVIMAEWYGGYGKTVQIKHKDGTVTQYSHLNSINCNVGDRVAQGAQVGEVGSTGNSTGAHLHFGVMVDGNYVDPLEYLDASGKEWNLDA